ncbi:hypothetical protein [Shewanella pneumatophori]|uniref:Uncharacterized protein n=1 Tax=Shewanella pneumatophori TaxID=314092 RepID=A0A9X1ZRN2_9GAMM|nr:hypothetical protein [Shewanella pneumatophori]MCL1140871.1 hypothetical protein [Shewanella pneumatophori]
MQTNIQYFNTFKEAGIYARNNPGSKVIREGERFKVEGHFRHAPMKAREQLTEPNQPVITKVAPPAFDDNFDDDIPF